MRYLSEVILFLFLLLLFLASRKSPYEDEEVEDEDEEGRPAPVYPPRNYTGPPKTTMYPDGRKVTIRPGRSITVYPDGRRVIVTVSSSGVYTTRVVKSGYKNPPTYPPRAYTGPPKTTVYPDGRKVTISNGKSVTVYPNGQTVVMTINKFGAIVTKVLPRPEPPIDCVGEWSSCSKSCGGGIQKYKITRNANLTGAKCPARQGQVKVCNTQGCPVDCKGSYAVGCSERCDAGKISYNVTQKPLNGGQACPKDKGCNMGKCAKIKYKINFKRQRRKVYKNWNVALTLNEVKPDGREVVIKRLDLSKNNLSLNIFDLKALEKKKGREWMDNNDTWVNDSTHIFRIRLTKIGETGIFVDKKTNMYTGKIPELYDEFGIIQSDNGATREYEYGEGAGSVQLKF